MAGSCGAFCSFCGKCGRRASTVFATVKVPKVAPPGVADALPADKRGMALLDVAAEGEVAQREDCADRMSRESDDLLAVVKNDLPHVKSGEASRIGTAESQ